MSLQEYEEVIHTIDKSKSWINVKYKQLISREISGSYYRVVKKLNRIYEDYEYFVIIGNDEFSHSREYHRVYRDDYGRAKLNVSSIFHLLANGRIKDFQVSLAVVEREHNYVVYRIDA